jgi:sulfate transport system permease protein
VKSIRVARLLAVTYLGLLIGVPLFLVFQRAFAEGWGAFVAAVNLPETLSAIRLTVIIAVIVTPLNLAFGIGAALVIVRRPSWGTKILNVLIDVPLAISPIVIGLMLELAYASNGWFGQHLALVGWQIMFSWPGIALASAVVSLPLVARSVIPVLEELGRSQEVTAETLGASPWYILRTITLPTIGGAALYGGTLTLARIIGEYGAVLIVSGNVALHTQTLTLNIAENFENYMPQQGFAGSALLALLSIVVLAALAALRRREGTLREN